MDTKEILRFYNDEKYWNLDQREEFINQTTTLWRGLADKKNGQIFSGYQTLSDEEMQVRKRVNRELE